MLFLLLPHPHNLKKKKISWKKKNLLATPAIDLNKLFLIG